MALTDSQLKAIEERKTMAADKRIHEKARAVVENKGATPKPYGENGYVREFEKGSLKLRCHTMSCHIHVEIEYEGRKVFDVTHHMKEVYRFDAYIPGDWERELDDAYRPLGEKEDEVIRNYLREKFGL